jgi:hypothetical protein
MKTLVTAAIVASTLVLGGCATGTSGSMSAADANAALGVASALEAVYAAQPSAKPEVVAELSRLLSAGQAALITWQSSSSPSDAQALNAAIAALVAYEASAGLSK